MKRINRREFLKTASFGAGALALSGCSALKGGKGAPPPSRPNIIFILADDLGYQEVGCYGQTKIRTPNIDKLAARGMRFTQHYSGNTVCAPSRCVLLTGKHTGHAYIRDNYEMGGWTQDAREGQLHLPPGTETIGTMLQRKGYKTAVIGKWGLGGPDTSGEPNRQGFDHWYGYLCQRIAHNYYPTHLWRDGRKEMLEGNEYFSAHQRLPKDKDPNDKASYRDYSAKQYAPDLMAKDALRFIRENKDNPFFLYFATPVPHVSLQVPEDSLQEYEGLWPETPYQGQKGYLPQIAPRAAYAAMITRMDRHIGRIMDLLEELGIADNTLVFFSSDNGPTFNGGTDSAFFNSAGPFRGLKCSLYEGGIRVPFIARWPGKIAPGKTSDHISAFWDIMPTLAEITGAKTPRDIDGISLLPTLLGQSGQQEHDYLYWEYSSSGGKQAVRMGDWKAVRLNVKKNAEAPIELYNLKSDIGEKYNVADENPEVVRKIRHILETARTESKEFPLHAAE